MCLASIKTFCRESVAKESRINMHACHQKKLWWLLRVTPSHLCTNNFNKPPYWKPPLTCFLSLDTSLPKTTICLSISIATWYLVIRCLEHLWLYQLSMEVSFILLHILVNAFHLAFYTIHKAFHICLCFYFRLKSQY